MTETDMKADNLHSLERIECMMVRWMCVVSWIEGLVRIVQPTGYSECD